MSVEMPVIDIDPDGDIILELSRPDGRTRLRVSSRVLALTSPVFARMFKSHFKEGLSYKSSSSRSPQVIPLPDEDEEVFTFLCNLLHYRLSGVPQTLKASYLGKLAVICDKWDLVKSIAPFVEQWFEGVNLVTEKIRYQILHLAYILDAPRAFSRIS